MTTLKGYLETLTKKQLIAKCLYYLEQIERFDRKLNPQDHLNEKVIILKTKDKREYHILT